MAAAKQTKETRFEYLKGRAASVRLRRKPVVYLPIGCLERHGSHLPMGLDVLKAQAICQRCAAVTGGVVYPPHFYSGVHFVPNPNADPAQERRRQQLIRQRVREWNNLYTDETCEAHLAEVLSMLREMGVRVVVLYSGHYPVDQVAMIGRLAARFNRGRKPPMRVIPFHERGLFGDGDHAGVWETSLLLATRPEEVDMRRIGPREFQDHRWNEAHDPRKATATFGEKAIRRIAAHLKKEIAAALKATAAAD